MPQFVTTIGFRGQQYRADFDIVEGVPANVVYSNPDGSELTPLQKSLSDELEKVALEILFADPRAAKQKWQDKKFSWSGNTKDTHGEPVLVLQTHK